MLGIKKNRIFLNKDRAVQEAVLKREIKNKIFLKKNNYDIQKSFFEILNELNSYLNYKLSRNYKDFDFVNRVFEENNNHYLMNQFVHLIVICWDFRMNILKRNDRIKYFRKLAKKIKNYDFDVYIQEIEDLAIENNRKDLENPSNVEVFPDDEDDEDDDDTLSWLSSGDEVEIIDGDIFKNPYDQEGGYHWDFKSDSDSD